jgi:hypothetical protein
MGGTAEVLPASRLRNRMAREVDVGVLRTIEAIRGRDHQRQIKGRPDQTGGVTRALVASERLVVVDFAFVAGRFGAAVG